MTKFICQVCGYVHEGAEPPEVCPLCGAPKSMFKSADAPAEKPRTALATVADTIDGLNTIEKSVVLTELANGCDKQHKTEARDILLDLGEQYRSAAKKPEKASFENLAVAIGDELDTDYPQVTEIAKNAGDRGALRVLTWGGKGTMSQKAVLDRYLTEGDAMLKGQNIYVCPICGFISIGTHPPEKCPVCSIPPWRFEVIKEED
ncbi:MAG TPA: hypothetical protein O0X27_06395 [Methanocorpusculum sp.]|nr:hypothetical protein [Methanocorpusculum sp.]